jgi:hypothetical protein
LITSRNSLIVSGDSSAKPVAIPFDNYLNTNNACLYDWICDGIQGRCDIQKVAEIAKSSVWRVENQPIEYCLAESVQLCTLNFNTYIMIVTLICNVAMAACMYYGLF